MLWSTRSVIWRLFTPELFAEYRKQVKRLIRGIKVERTKQWMLVCTHRSSPGHSFNRLISLNLRSKCPQIPRVSEEILTLKSIINLADLIICLQKMCHMSIITGSLFCCRYTQFWSLDVVILLVLSEVSKNHHIQKRCSCTDLWEGPSLWGDDEPVPGSILELLGGLRGRQFQHYNTKKDINKQ